MSGSKTHAAGATGSALRAGLALLGAALLLGSPGNTSALAPATGGDAASRDPVSSTATQSLLPTPTLHALSPILADVDMRDDGYNSEYIFGLTKGIASSTVHPAIKPICFVLTVPLDLVFLPFAAIGGFF
jgi:hypothetical protein